MENTEKVTENQEPKLYGGKYKTVEEMEAAFKQVEREASETKEALDREQRLNSLLATESRSVAAPAQNTTTDYDLSSVLGEEGSKTFKGALEGYRTQVLNEARSLVHETVSSVRAQDRAEKAFYKTYPELDEFKEEVDRQASVLSRELGPDRARVVPQDKLFSEVAKRTKEYLSTAKQKLIKSPIHVEGGEVTEPTIQSSKKEASSSVVEDRAKNYFDDEVKKWNEKKNRSLRG